MTPIAALALLLAPQDISENPRITPEVLAVAQVRPSVVCVRTTYPALSLQPRFEGGRVQPPREEIHQLVGSGLVVDQSGFLLTSYHLVDVAARLPSARITVTFDPAQSDRVYDAQLVSWVSEEDLALVKVDSDGPFTAAPLGSSSDLMLAERVITIGNPFGRRHSVSVGVVSGLHRRLRRDRSDDDTLTDLIQLDVPVDPGSAGGPVINILGEVVGIVTSSGSQAGAHGYALPIDRVKEVLRESLFAPSAARAWLGFEVAEVTDAGQSQVLVTHVTEGGPAAESGLEAGHRVLAVNGKEVHDVDAFRLACLPLQPGEELSLLVLCAGEQESMVARGWPRQDGILFERMGLTVRPRLLERGLPFMQVTRLRPGGPAAELGFALGDFFDAVSLEGSDEVYRMSSSADLARFVEPLPPGSQLRIDVRRDADGDRSLSSDEIYTGSLTLD